MLPLKSTAAAGLALLLLGLLDAPSPGPDWRPAPPAPLEPAPAPPLGLLAVREGTATAITWIGPDDPDAVGWEVYRRCDPRMDWVLVSPTLLLERRFADLTAVEGFEYEYRVAAVDASGRSALSAPFAIEEAGP